MRAFRFFLLLLAAGLLLMRESRLEPLARAEASFPVWLSAHAGRPAPEAPVVVVEITGEELAEREWPWAPLDYSLFASAALSFKPAVLAIEPMLSWEKPEPSQLALLHRQLLRAPKVLLGAQLGFSERGPAPLPAEIPILTEVAGDTSRLISFSDVLIAPDPALRPSTAIGFENLFLGERRFIRRVPLVFSHCGRVVPSFVLQGAMLWYGVLPEEVVVEPGRSVRLGPEVEIPINERGEMIVRAATRLTRLSYGDLLLAAGQAEAGRKPAAPAARLENAFVILTRTDRMAPILDFGGRSGSRGELFALALGTIAAKEFIRPAPALLPWVILAAGLLLGLVASRKSLLWTAGAALLAACGYLLAVLALFASAPTAFPLVLPLGLAGAVVLLRALFWDPARQPET